MCSASGSRRDESVERAQRRRGRARPARIDVGVELPPAVHEREHPAGPAGHGATLHRARLPGRAEPPRPRRPLCPSASDALLQNDERAVAGDREPLRRLAAVRQPGGDDVPAGGKRERETVGASETRARTRRAGRSQSERCQQKDSEASHTTTTALGRPEVPSLGRFGEAEGLEQPSPRSSIAIRTPSCFQAAEVLAGELRGIGTARRERLWSLAGAIVPHPSLAVVLVAPADPY